MKIPRLATGSARLSRSMSPRSRYRARLALAVAFSLLVHGVILSLRFGAPGLGLPGLDLPWAERRVKASQLTVRLLEVPRAAPAALEAPPVASDGGIQLKLSTELSNLPRPIIADRAFEGRLVQAEPRTVPPAVPRAVDATRVPLPATRREAPAIAAPSRGPEPAALPRPLPPVLALKDSQSETFNVPPAPQDPVDVARAPETAAKKERDEPQPQHIAEETLRKQAEEAARQREEEARQRVLALKREQEVKRLEEVRRAEEARRIEEARKLDEARRIAEARQIEEARRQEEARLQLEAKKQEEAQRLALELEARKRAEDLARQQAIAREKELGAKRQAEEAAARAREVAERERAEKEAAARRERERLAAQEPAAPAPRALPGSELAAKALEQFRRPRAQPPEPPRSQPPATTADTRRRSIFGVERDVSLKLYVDSWRWKIERNGTYNYRPTAAFHARENPIVTVSIRSDGSLEHVLIDRSSGVAEIDDAVKRIAHLHAPYSKFPPDLARQYDVIEIRRVWLFQSRLRLLEEM